MIAWGRGVPRRTHATPPSSGLGGAGVRVRDRDPRDLRLAPAPARGVPLVGHVLLRNAGATAGGHRGTADALGRHAPARVPDAAVVPDLGRWLAGARREPAARREL